VVLAGFFPELFSTPFWLCAFAVCNVALNRPSFQSTTHHGESAFHGAYLGNDGTLSYDGLPPCCAHSDLETNPWWAVDLGMPLSVQEIVFTNRPHAGVGE